MVGNCILELGGTRISGLYNRRDMVEELVLEQKILSLIRSIECGPCMGHTHGDKQHNALVSNTSIPVQASLEIPQLEPFLLTKKHLINATIN